MGVKGVIAELRKLPADVDVHIYASKCCEVQSIDRVHFQPGDENEPPLVVLVDETETPANSGAL